MAAGKDPKSARVPEFNGSRVQVKGNKEKILRLRVFVFHSKLGVGRSMFDVQWVHWAKRIIQDSKFKIQD
jgi:hypothetical protein